MPFLHQDSYTRVASGNWWANCLARPAPETPTQFTGLTRISASELKRFPRFQVIDMEFLPVTFVPRFACVFIRREVTAVCTPSHSTRQVSRTLVCHSVFPIIRIGRGDTANRIHSIHHGESFPEASRASVEGQSFPYCTKERLRCHEYAVIECSRQLTMFVFAQRNSYAIRCNSCAQ
jgi:hypothetical protein